MCFATALLYGIYFIQEPALKAMHGSSFRDIFLEIFDIQSVKDTVSTVIRKRPGPRRKYVLGIIIFTLKMVNSKQKVCN